MEAPKRLPMTRIGTGSKGQSTPLLSNHYSVTVSKNDGYFCHYDVAMSYDGDRDSVQVKGIGRKVLDEVCKIYGELKNLNFAYDGEKNLYTVGSLSKNRLDFTVVLEEVSSRVGRNRNPDLILVEGDAKRTRRQSRSKTIKVELNYVTKIPMKAIADALRGLESEKFQEALRVLDIILRQRAANRDCLLVRQSYFHNSPSNRIDIGGGVQACRGFHSSFRATQGGLTLNMDVSTTIILQTGPVLEFLSKNQNVNNAYRIDWNKAKRILKNLRIKANGIEFKITGLSENTCRNQRFLLRQRNGNGEVQESEITVYDYFTRHKMIILKQSADMPCINVGKPKRPCYFPIELCELVSLQRYTKALTNLQRTQLVTATRQLPQKKKEAVENSLRSSGYNDEPMLRSCGITIQPDLSMVEGRVLRPPNLLVGTDEEIIPQNGRWNFNNKKLYRPVTIMSWAIVNFSSGYDTYRLKEFIKKNAREKGMDIRAPYKIIFEEKGDFRHIPAEVRVEKMYANVMRSMGRPQFLLCILPERKNSDLYGPWKRRCLVDGGVITQCIAPTKNLNDQYITNVLLKINAKCGGVNSFLSNERYESIPHVSTVPTLILGMDVSHGSPGRADVPSIAAVTSSRCWPQITRYRATVRTQSSKVEMIQSLFKPVLDNTRDEGIIREVLEEFTATAIGRRKPEHIIIFRDGVSESQFNQVLNFELSQIIEACKHFDEKWEPKFALIVAQKNHHTRFFLADPPQTTHRSRPSPAELNVKPGTIIDKNVCHPRNNDFYLCAQAGMIGTTRPTHYHVLHDEIGFTADEIQELVHSLSYTYQRSTSAVSLVAPVCYAHLAAAQMAQFVKFDEHTETSSSSHGGLTSAAAPPVPQLPRLHDSVKNTMFFC